MLLDAGHFILVALQALDPGRDMHGGDAFESDVALVDPSEEILGYASIGVVRVRIVDMGGKEFDQAFGGTFAGPRNHRRQNDAGGQSQPKIRTSLERISAAPLKAPQEYVIMCLITY